MYKNTLTRYGSISKLFHWLIFFLVFFMILLGYFMGDIQDKAARSIIINIHKVTGINILILMILRLAWRFMNVKPVLANTKLWEKILEKLVHGLLYLVLFSMPLSGWIMSSASGKPPHIVGWQFGLPVTQSKALAELFVSIHNTLAIVLIVLVSLHVAAALFHHFIKKDDVLTRMTPM